MKNLLVTAFLLAIFFLITFPVAARSGCCSWHGGVRSDGCGCNDGTSLSSTCAPYYTCNSGGYYQAPVYVPPPSCSLNSYYDSASSSCKCYSGYVSNGSSCISNQQYCWNNYGYNSTYDYGSAKCACSYGYAWNSAGTSCISKDESCHNQLGIMSRYESFNDTCDCLSGYSIQGGQCLLNPVKYVPVYNRIPEIPTQIYDFQPTDTSTLIPTNTPISTLTPTPTQKSVKKGLIKKQINKKPNKLKPILIPQKSWWQRLFGW